MIGQDEKDSQGRDGRRAKQRDELYRAEERARVMHHIDDLAMSIDFGERVEARSSAVATWRKNATLPLSDAVNLRTLIGLDSDEDLALLKELEPEVATLQDELGSIVDEIEKVLESVDVGVTKLSETFSSLASCLDPEWRQRLDVQRANMKAGDLTRKMIVDHNLFA